MLNTTISHYRVTEKIGAGGMGEVYRATDERLDRDVAIKVLPGEVANDEARLARFEREAKLLASLNHQNIATLHGLEEHEGQGFLVMELAEGTDLAHRIALRPVPIDEALDYARQIAEGLEAAHEKGIIHRDLKPANIMLSSVGGIKILDFGLAKAFEPPGSDPSTPESIADSPTLTAAVTGTGVLLGTAAYMSPEQARGKAVDKRADVWAFGCVLFEMLTGKKAFQGNDASQVMAAILRDDPEWSELPPGTPDHVRRLLARCLVKNPRDRLHDIADARIELSSRPVDDEIRTETIASAQVRRGLGTWLPWSMAAVSMAVTIAAVLGLQQTPPPGSAAKVFVGLSPAEWLGSNGPNKTPTMFWRLSRTAFALSPDGRFLVFSGGDASGSRLYLRDLEGLAASPMAGTEDGTGPFFSPDGHWIGFWADGKLKKVPIDGGPPIPICDVARCPEGASWGPDDTIVFGQNGIQLVSAYGGEPEEIVEGPLRHPQLLPDGDTLLFTDRKTGRHKEATIYAQSLTTGEKKALIENAADACYAPTGHLVFARLGVLMAAPFDARGLTVTGPAAVIVDSVRQAVNSAATSANTFEAQFAFSASGLLVYAPGGVWPDPQDSLVWVDHDGKVEPLEMPHGHRWTPRVSPDGTRVVYWDSGFLRDQVWIHDIARNTQTRVTVDGGSDCWPLWTPDGATISLNHPFGELIYSIAADGSGPAELLAPSASVMGIPLSWSPDGQVLAYAAYTDGISDIWMLPRSGDPWPFIASGSYDAAAAFSPDGAWLAYQSQGEVFVTPYPGPGPKIQVSANGGYSPAWSPNGQGLFYRRSPTEGESGNTAVWAVEITTKPELRLGKPRKLFDWPGRMSPGRGYDVAPDGQRFLMVKAGPRQEEPVTQLHVTFNWFEELNRLAPPN